jgi:hypothetical protein
VYLLKKGKAKNKGETPFEPLRNDWGYGGVPQQSLRSERNIESKIVRIGMHSMVRI